MFGRLIIAIACAALVVGCGGPQPSAPGAVALQTWVPDSPVACPMARTEGTLVRHPQSGAGLRDNQGVLWQVIWPTDYQAREDGGLLAVLDGAGVVIAHEGDRVEIAGAQDDVGVWLGCGGMRLLSG